MAIASTTQTTHPSIPSGAWTKVTAIEGSRRKRLILLNEDPTNTFRFEICNSTVAATLGATSGLPLAPATGGVGTGGLYEEDYDNLTTEHAYVYQASGGALTTLAVKEGV